MANLSNINGKFVVEQTTGYVGVGTTDPNYPIEVLNASAEIALNSSGGSIYRLRSDSTDSFRINKNGVGDRLVINSLGNATFSGNVDIIKTTSDVAGELRIGGILASDNLPFGKINFANTAVANSQTNDVLAYIAGEKTGSSNKGELTFATSDNSAPVERLRIDSSGNSTFAGAVTGGNGTFTNLTISATEKLRFDGAGGHTYIEEDSNDTLIFATGGTTRLTLNANATFAGNVTTAQINLNSSGGGIIDNQTGNIFIQTPSGTGWIFRNGASGYDEKMRIDSNGNVGIGTDIPGAKFSIASGVAKTSTSTPEVLYLGQSNEASNYSALQVYIKGGASQADRSVFFQTIESGVANAGNIILQPSGGNVGIGGTPSTFANFTNVTIQGGSSGSNLDFKNSSGTRVSAIVTTASNELIIETGTAQPMIFKTNDTEVMRIASSSEIQFGNGTNNAGFLDFDGTSVQINTQRNPNTGAFVDSAKSNGSINIVGANGGSYIRFNTAAANNTTATERMRITSAGQIEFAATYNNTTASAANMHISSAGGQIFRSTSSLKYKTDVRDYDKGLNEVMQLQPKYYKGKDDGDTQFAGLIAEDVNDLGLSEFVQYAEDGTPDALAYTHMVALLVKSIQELKAEIELLKNK